MAIVNPDDLKRTLIDGINYVLDRPVRYWLTEEQRQILRAQKAYWQGADAVQSQELYRLFAAAPPYRGEDRGVTEPDQPEPI